MSTMQWLVPLWVSLGGLSLVWWAQQAMQQADDELSAFAQQADLKLDN